MNLKELILELNRDAIAYKDSDLDDALDRMESDPRYIKHREYDELRNQKKNVHGQYVSSKHLKDIDDIREPGSSARMELGTIYISFARCEEKGRENEIKLDVEYIGAAETILGSYGSNEYDTRKKSKWRFESPSSFYLQMKNSIELQNGGVDRKSFRDNVLNPKNLTPIVRQIQDFVQDFPLRAKSLDPKYGYDMEVKLRFDWDENIHGYAPRLSGAKKYGRMIPNNKDVPETYDRSLWEARMMKKIEGWANSVLKS